MTEDSDEAVSNSIAGIKVAPVLPQIESGTDVAVSPAHAANLVFHKNAFAFFPNTFVAKHHFAFGRKRHSQRQHGKQP